MPIPTQPETKTGQNSGLQLGLIVRPTGNGTFKFEVQEFNDLDSQSRVQVAENWPASMAYFDPFDSCGSSYPSPIGLMVLQGNYGLGNFTTGAPLTLFNSTYATSCTAQLYPTKYYIFEPLSDFADAFDSRGYSAGNQTIAFSLSSSGYWTGGYGISISNAPPSFHAYAGAYTVVAADEWGSVVIEHFSVLPAS